MAATWIGNALHGSLHRLLFWLSYLQLVFVDRWRGRGRGIQRSESCSWQPLPGENFSFDRRRGFEIRPQLLLTT